MTCSTVYRTIRAARNALALDNGFDPFVSGGWGRPTKAKLAEAGYPVDPAEYRRRRAEAAQREAAGLCRVCGAESETDGSDRPRPSGLCREHTRYTYVCDAGHRWTATEDEDAAAHHCCPECGECWT